jgi:hypothetical protein
MGYGHLRAAHALAEHLDTAVLHVDEAPLADAEERDKWARARRAYEFVSRASQLPIVGRPFGWALGALTAIPRLYPLRDLSAPTAAVRTLERAVRKGLGAGLVARLRDTGESLLTTFYAPAIGADHGGCARVFCVVTDTDVNRVWAPGDAGRTAIQYLVPGPRAARRLRAYGVPAANIHLTGFPLPPGLLGGRDLPVLRRNLLARLGRLDPKGVFAAEAGDELRHFLGPLPAADGAPLVTFAVGGAGAQAELARRFLPTFAPALRDGRLRLALVAGVRDEVAARFSTWVDQAGLGAERGRAVRILHAPDVPTYLRRFNDLLAETDVLWTKPSELTFFGALGLPLLMAPPVGRHESYNLRWARECGVGFKQRDVETVAQRILDRLDDGSLAAAAFAGYVRMPKFGTYRIADAVAGAR